MSDNTKSLDLINEPLKEGNLFSYTQEQIKQVQDRIKEGERNAKQFFAALEFMKNAK